MTRAAMAESTSTTGRVIQSSFEMLLEGIETALGHEYATRSDAGGTAVESQAEAQSARHQIEVGVG